jgi:beta-galactosidase
MPELARLGAVQAVTPAPQWQRHLFSGLAQVIVQAGSGAGSIKLSATAVGLRATEAVIAASPAPLRPSVP